MNFKTKQNLTLIFTPLVSILTILFVLQSIIPSYAEELGQLDINVKYTNGDRASAYNILMKIFYKGTNDLYTELEPNSEYPYFVTMLPVNQEFRIEAYVNGMYSGSYNIDIKNKYHVIDFIIPLSSGVQFHVLYNDKYTSIEGASIQIKNQDGKILRKDFTDKDGKSLRVWTAPTILEDNYYEVKISIGEKIVHTYSPLYLMPGERKDLKIFTPWPKLIESPIIIQAYKIDMNPLTYTDGKYIAELYDDENNKVAKSNLNNNGEAYFSLIPLGDYHILIKEQQEGLFTIFANQTITIENNSQKIPIIGKKTPRSEEDTSQKNIDFIQQGVFLDSGPKEEKIIPLPTKKPEIKKLSCHCVAFRFDDIQDHWLNDVQIEVMEAFQNRNLPITIGLIGDRIGKDTKIISYIEKGISNNSIQVANHGWTHEDFTSYNKTHQSTLMQKTNEKIHNLFSVTPVVFIPPYNSFNDDTITAMIDNRITHFSSEFDFSTPPYPLVDESLYNFPEGAITGKLNEDKKFILGVNHKLTLIQINQSLEDHGFAVVTMHPQEFSKINQGEYDNQIDEKQIRELELLLDRLRFEKIKIVPLSKINLDSDQNDSIPKWIKNTAKWWAEGKISQVEFVSAMQYLVKENVIFLDKIPENSAQISKDVVPIWIKNNAQWWAEGKISDREFGFGIKYFIENGIITV